MDTKSVMDSIKKSLVTATLCRLISIGIMYATPPIFLIFGGADLLGQWLILITIPVALNLLDLGLPHIAGSFMAIYFAQGDYSKYGEIFWSTLLFTACIFPILLGCAVLFHNTLQSFVPGTSDSEILAILLSMVVFQSQILASAFGAIRARGDINASLVGDTLARALELAFVVLALHTGPDLIRCLVGLISARVFVLVLSLSWLFGRRSGRMLFSCGPRWASFRTIIFPSLSYMLSGAAQLAYIQVPVLILGASIGPAIAAAYSTMRTLARTGPQLMLPFFDPIRPQLSSAFGRGQMGQVTFLFLRCFQTVFWSGLVGGIFLIVVAPSIFHAWTLNKLEFDPVTFRILLGSAFCYGLAQTCLLLLASVTAHQVYSILSFIGVTLAIAAYSWIGGGQRTLASLLFGYDVAAVLLGVFLAARFGNIRLFTLLRRGAAPPFWLLSEGKIIFDRIIK